MEQRARFKVVLYPRAAGSAATTNTFNSKKEAEEYAKSYGAGWQSEMTEVDENGRPTHPRTVPLASAGSPGGVERYVCTHCYFESDLPELAHDCTTHGRDDSFSQEPKEKTGGQLTAALVQRPGMPEEYVVDWVAEERGEKWRAALRKDELRQLRAENMWHGEVQTLESFGIVVSTTVEMDGPALRKFAFRHLRKM
jgi:hypothetical protein